MAELSHGLYFVVHDYTSHCTVLVESFVLLSLIRDVVSLVIDAQSIPPIYFDRASECSFSYSTKIIAVTGRA